MAATVTGADAPRGIDATVAATRRPIRVAIVDDHPVVREGTAAVLAAQPGYEVVGTAGDLDEARELVAGRTVDVMLLDIRLGTASGLHLLAGDNSALPAIVVLTAFDYPQYAQAAREHGAAGFVVKTAPLPELLDAIRRAAAGERMVPPEPSAGSMRHLSPRELEITRLVADGRSNDEIAGRLGIGARTVETHLARIFERFGIASRTELAMRALRDGWLDLPAG